MNSLKKFIFQIFQKIMKNYKIWLFWKTPEKWCKDDKIPPMIILGQIGTKIPSLKNKNFFFQFSENLRILSDRCKKIELWGWNFYHIILRPFRYYSDPATYSFSRKSQIYTLLPAQYILFLAQFKSRDKAGTAVFKVKNGETLIFYLPPPIHPRRWFLIYYTFSIPYRLA